MTKNVSKHWIHPNQVMISLQAQLFKHGKRDDFLQYGVYMSYRSFFGLYKAKTYK